MIKMHCDRCDISENVRWTKGREAGDPLTPENWGEVRAPRTGTHTLEKYILCPNCLIALHAWIQEYGIEWETVEKQPEMDVSA